MNMVEVSIKPGNRKVLTKCYYLTKNYAVTKSLDENNYTYVITYIKLGVKVCACSNKNIAIALCRILNKKFPNPYIDRWKVRDFAVELFIESSVSNFHVRTYNC